MDGIDASGSTYPLLSNLNRFSTLLFLFKVENPIKNIDRLEQLELPASIIVSGQGHLAGITTRSKFPFNRCFPFRKYKQLLAGFRNAVMCQTNVIDRRNNVWSAVTKLLCVSVLYWDSICKSIYSSEVEKWSNTENNNDVGTLLSHSINKLV